MHLSEIEQICEKIESKRNQLEEQLANLRKLESEAKEKTKEAQMLKEIAKLRGEKVPAEPEVEELEKARKMAEALRDEIQKLEQEVYQGLKEVTFDIPLELPEIEAGGKSTTVFEGGPYNHAITFMARTMNSDAPLELDKVQIYPDRIMVTNVREVPQVIERLHVLRSNISRLARIALQEKDPDVEEVVEYLHGSDYYELWEAVKGKRSISYTEIYSELGISEPKDKKRVRNFFTNIEQLLKEKCPFMRVASGVYELTFFGSLVWKRYRDKYLAKGALTEPQKEKVVEAPIKEAKQKAEMASLNKYLSNEEIKEVIYGKEAS